MQIAQRRDELAQMRQDVQTWLQRPNVSLADRQWLQSGLAKIEQLERDLEDYVRLVQFAIERFDEPRFERLLTGEEDGLRS
jgi:hypothetical protein